MESITADELFFFVAKHHMAACRRNIVAETLLQKHYRRNIVAETLLQKTLLQKTGVKCFSPYPKPPEAAEHGTDFFPPGQCKACPGIAPLRGGSGPFFTHQFLQDVSDLPHRPFPVHEMPPCPENSSCNSCRCSSVRSICSGMLPESPWQKKLST